MITILSGRSPWSPWWTLTPTSTTGSTWTRTRSLSLPGLRGDSSFLPKMALLSAILFQKSTTDGSAICHLISKNHHRWLCYRPSYFKIPPKMALLSTILFLNSATDGSAISNLIQKFRHRRLCYQQSYYNIPPTDGSAIGHLFKNSTNRWLCYRPSYLRIPPYMIVSAILFKKSATLRLCCSSKILHRFHNIFICKLCYDIFINYLF